MASFPDLRPNLRSARAESGAAPSSRRFAFLMAAAAALAVVSVLAFLVVSELATLHGAKASVRTPAFLTHALGSPDPSASQVRKPAPGTSVSLSPGGYRVTRGGHALALTLEGGHPGNASTFARGLGTTTSFGRAIVVVTPKTTEQYLVVGRHHGMKTWRWRLDSAELTPRVGDDGYVGFIADHSLINQFAIAPPRILDRRARDISPRALHWDVVRRGGAWSLELALDDATLPTPYTIDPGIVFDTGGATVGNTAAAASVTINIPAGVKVNDQMILAVSWKNPNSNVTPTTPAGWTQIGATLNQATNTVGTAVYRRAAQTGDAGGTVTVNLAPSAVATGGIAAYTGVDNSSPVNQGSSLATAASNSFSTFLPSIIPTVSNTEVVSIVGWDFNSGGTGITPPTSPAETERYQTNNSGSVTSEISSFTQGTAAAVSSSGTASNKNKAFANFRVALKPDTTNPTAPAPTIAESSPDSAANGSTFYYRPAGAGGTFTVTEGASDTQSGVNNVSFPGLAGNFTPTSATSVTGTPYSNTYTWPATTGTESGSKTITVTDKAGNTATNTFSIVSDSTAPAGGVLTVNGTAATGGGSTSSNTSGSFTIGTRTDYTETQNATASGLASSVLTRESATFSSPNACGSFGGSTTIAGAPAQGPLATGCYRYVLTGTDNVGNSVTLTTIVKVDTSAPSTPTLAFSGLSSNAYYDGSGNLYFRPAAGGAFTVTAASTDSDTGIASYTFGTLNSNGGSNWGGSQTGDHFDYTFGASTTAPTTARTVNSTNNAGGNSSNATYTIASDTTGPSVTAPTVTAGYYTSLSVPVTKNGGSDAGSGLAAGSSQLQRDVANLSNGSCGSFSGSWANVMLVGGNDTSVTSGHCYEYREQLTDNVGNAGSSSASNIAKVDTSAPSTPALAFSGLSASAYYDGAGTFYFRPSVGGTFTVTASSTDGESGIGSYTFGTLNSNGGSNWGGSQTGDHFDYTFGSSTTAPTTARTVSATNGAGTGSANATFTISADTTAPTVPAPTVTAGYYTSLSVPVTTGGATDGGSGVNAPSLIVQRDVANLSGGTCGSFGGSWTNVTLVGGNDTSVTNGHCYEYRQLVSDNVGNQGTSSASSVAKVDSQGPTNSLSLSAVAGGAYKSGTTVYYRGSATGGGSFKLTNAVTDSESGPASSATAALGGTSTGWSHTPSTVSTPAGGPYDSNAFSWSQGTNSAPTEVVTGADTAGNATAAPTLTFSNDSTAPSVTAPGVTGGDYTSLSVPVTKNGGSDGGSGIDATTSVLQRDVANLSGGSCGSFSGSWTTITLAGGNDTGVTNGHCYEYRELLSDNVGNQGASSASNIAKVDNQGPANTLSLSAVSGGAYKSGTMIYYRGAATGGGSFKITNNVSDSESGPASSATAALGGTSTGWSHTPSTVSTPAGGPYDSNAFSWNESTNSSPTEVVTGADAAGNTTAAPTLTFTNDSTAPAVTAPTVTAGYYTSLSVPVTKNGGTDGGSGVDATTSVLQRDVATLSNGSCGSFSGSWTTITPSGGNDTGVTNGHCYEYRELVSDNVGNQGTSSASSIAKVDNDPPANGLSLSAVSGGARQSGTTIYYRGSAAGSFKLTNAVSDSESGPASSATSALAGSSSGWSHTPSTVSTPAGGPYDSNAFSWSAGTSSAPTEVVTGTDAAGNATPAPTLTFTNDSTAPSVTAPSVAGGYYTSLSVPVTKNGGSDSGSGIDATTSVLQRDIATLANGSCGSFSGSWTTITLVGGNDTGVTNGHCYQYRELLSDQVGNQGTSSSSNIAKVDDAGPGNSITLSSVSPAGSAFKSGTTVYYRGSATGGGSFKLTNAVTDSESGPASSATAALGGTTSGWSHTPSTVSTPSGGPYDSNTFSWNESTNSSPTEVVTGTDAAGNATAAPTLTFTNDSTAPTGGALMVNGAAAAAGGTSSYSTTGSFPIDVRTDFDEAASATEAGLASSTLTRSSASYSSPDTCGSFGAPTTIAGAPAQNLATGCYRFTLTGTDNVGNTVTLSTIVKVDTSAPSTPTLSFANITGGAYYGGTGTTLYVRPSAANGSFDVTASSTEGDTGVANYSFPTAASMGAHWTASGSGATRTYSFTPTAEEPGTKTVTATNGAGAPAGTDFTVTADSAAPATTIQCNGTTCQNGTYYTSSPVVVTLSASDGTGSGVQRIRYTTDGSDPSPVNGSDYLSAIDVSATTTIRFRAYDNLSNEEAVGSREILLDGTPPTGPTLTLTENPASPAQHVSGTTLFYNPGASGTFRVAAATDDPETGVASVAFPAIANVTGGGTLVSAPYRMDYTWGASTSDSGSHSVDATNGAGATSSAPFTLTPDSAAPTGQSITLTGAGAPYYKTASVSFSLGDGNDGAGSGVDIATRTVTRESASLNGDSCGTFTADAGTYTSPDTAVSDGHCYRYAFTVADYVGNTSAPVTATSKVDTTGPTVSVSAPTELSGAGDQSYDAGTKTLYFRPAGSGSFALNATASDSATAVTGVDFPDVSGTSGWSGSTGGTDASSPYSSPATYAWTSGAGAPGEQTVTATDRAGNGSSDRITIAADPTAPTGQTISLTGGSAPYFTSTSVTFALGDGTDSGSGIDTATRTVTRETGTLSNGTCSGFTADGGTYTSPDSAVSTGHCYRYSFTIQDNVGNVSSAVQAIAKVDTDAPSVAVSSPAALTGVGNQYYDAAGQTLYFRPSGSGSFVLNATASDGESDIAGVAFPDVSGVSGWSGSTGGSDSSSPYSSPVDYTWTSGATAPATRTITATNGAGMPAGATITIAADSGAPTGQAIALTGASAPYFSSASVSFSLTDGADSGSGLDMSTRTVTRESASLNGDTCGTFTADVGTFSSPDTSVSGGHCYRYTFTIADRVGNTSAPVTATAKVDTAAPSASVTAPTALTGAGNQYYDAGSKTQFFRSTGSGSFVLNANASDTHTAVAGVAFPDVSGTSGWSGSTGGTDTSSPYSSPATYAWSSGAGDPGAQTVTATDKAGNDGTDTVTFKDDATAPSGQAITLTGAAAPYSTSNSVTFSLADGTDNSGGSGLDTSSRSVTRETGTLTNGSCSAFTADAGTFTSPDTAVSNGHCYRYTFVESDNVGNQASGVQVTAKVDTADPSASLTDPGTPLHGTVTLNATATDGESAVQQVAFQRAPAGGSTWTTIGTDTGAPYSTDWDTTGVTDGLYDLRAIVTDGAGRTGTSALVTNRRVDNTAPDTTIDSHPPDPSNDSGPTFEFSSSESGSTFECRLDGGSWASCSSPDTLSGLSEATHTFDVRATDAAGNTDASPASYTWTIDETAPNTTIDAHPSNPSNNPTPAFQFSADQGGSTFECRIDGSAWSACTSPHTLGTLGGGSHTFDVRARNAAGTADPSPASYTWTIDLTQPTVTITAPTQYISSLDPVNYTVTASTPDTDVAKVDFYECSNGSTACSTGTWNLFATDTTSPYSGLWTTPAFDGPKAIRAVATDQAGNTGEQVRTITIDRTAPTGVSVSYPNGYAAGGVTITTDNGPDPDVNAPTGVIERQTGTLANDSCSGFGGFSAVTSPDTVASGSCAIYRYEVADHAGNLAVATSTNVVKSDTAAPTSSVGDPGTNLRQTIVLTATSSDTGGSGVSSVAFQRKPSSGGSWTTIGSDTTAPYSVSFDTASVSDGLYDFRAVATDLAGNIESSPTSVTNRRIDNTPPSATMLSPGNPVHGPVMLSSTTSDGGSGIATIAYEIAPNGGSFSTQPALWDTTGVIDGLYDLHVVATDVAGNSTTSALITTRVDNTPPSVTFSSPATGAVVSGIVPLTASASDAQPASPAITFAYKLHTDSSWTTTSASWNTTALPAGDGVYDLRASATDAAGNVTEVVNANVRVDNVPPSLSITAPPASINGSMPSPTTFSASATDAGSGVAQVEFFECSNTSVDCATGTFNSLAVDTTAPYSTSWNIPSDGNHALEAVGADNAGHLAASIVNVSVDSTPPDTAMTAHPADPSSAAATFTFVSTESGSTFECSLDGAVWTACASPKTFTGLTDGQHTVEVRATDMAGNTDPTPASWTWHRDTSAPAGTLNDPGRNVRGTVALTSVTSDPTSNGYGSGIASVSYQYSADGTTWATIGTLTSSPFDTIDWTTNGISDGVYQLHVVVTDVAGNVTTSPAVTNVRIDNTPPTTSQDDPGTYLRAAATLTGSAADTGSGVDHVDFQLAPSGGGPWTTIGTDTTAPYSGSLDTTSVPDGHYDFRTVAVDVAGNQGTSIPVTSRLVDNTPPTATMNDPSTAGGYVRGTINLTSVTDDPNGSDGSGVASVAYEYSTNGGGTWTNTGSTLNTTALPDGSLQLHAVVTDRAGNTTTSAPVTDTIDNTRPVTTDDAPAGWQAADVTVHLSASDAGSGVNVTEYSVDGGSYTVGTTVTIPAPGDGSNDGAHTIAYFSADHVGNIEQVKSTTVLIDATPPACPSCSAADYLRGTVTLSASPADGGAGIKSVVFQYTDAGGSTWTTIGTDTSGPAPYTAVWDTTLVPDGHYDLRILVTDLADNTTTTDLPDKVVDNTPPNVSTVGAPTEGAVVSGNVGITASAADVTSPIASVQFFVRGNSIANDATPPYTATWDSTSGPDGSATIQVVVTDMAGNSATSALRTITVDNRSPVPTLDDPGLYLRGLVTLTASSDPDTVQVDFQRAAAGSGTWTTISTDTSAPFSAPLDTSTLADGVYDFRAVATDGTGNTGTSSVRANVRVDNTPPSGSLTAPIAGATVGGPSVHLAASTSDAGSGVASVSYELRPTGGGSFTAISSSTSAPFDGSWNTAGLATGDYDLRPVITDRAGNSFAGATVTVHVDATAPTIVLENPGATIAGSVTLKATVTGTGATQVTFFVSPAGANAWQQIGTDSAAPWSSGFNTTSVTDGLYDLRAVVSDSLGNTSQSIRTNSRIDNTAPSLVSSTPADGSTVDSASSIELVASEPVTATDVTLDGAGTVAPVITGAHILYNTGALATGLHVLAGSLTDASGKSSPFRVHFTVWQQGSGTPPPVEGNTGPGGSASVSSADGFATVTMPTGAYAASGHDWIVIKITTISSPSVANGFAPGSEVVDVTAYWALSGEPVHHFDRPLQIVLRASGKGLVPATLETGWRALRRVPSGFLPDGWADGFYSDGSGFHLFTLHLSQFTVLRDVQAPAAPSNVRGFRIDGHLILTWTPGADNSGTYDYVRALVNGAGAGDFGSDVTRGDLGPYDAHDSRTITLRETDLAGNDSPETRPLLPVPPLVGKPVAAAESALVGAGFQLGTVTEGGVGEPGTVTAPDNLVLAEAGSAIDVTIVPGGAFTKFVFNVVSSKKFMPGKQRTLAARILLTRRAQVTAVLYGPRSLQLSTWRYTLKAGRSIVKLRVPVQIRRPGSYSIRWTARAGTDVVTRTIRIRLVRGKGAAKPREVVLAGSAVLQHLPLGTRSLQAKVVSAVGEDSAFELVGAGSNGVQVMVVDVDQFGVKFVRDLHTVFPHLRIVALARSPRTLAAALKAGAAVALPSSTPNGVLAAVISKQLRNV